MFCIVKDSRNTFCSWTGLRAHSFKSKTLRTKPNTTPWRALVTLVIALSGTINTLGQNPVANFTANVTSGCAPLSVNFTDLSTGSPTTWNWEFSNGTLSSAQNPTVTFSAPGTYSVKLVVQNSSGIAELERINYITVFPTPTVGFSANLTLSCIPATVTFTDQSTPAGGPIVAWPGILAMEVRQHCKIQLIFTLPRGFSPSRSP